VKFFFIISTLVLAFACSRKPGKEDCARYNRHISDLAGHPAIDAAMKSADGKAAVQAHCMELKKSQVECASEATTLSDSLACESRKGSILDF